MTNDGKPFAPACERNQEPIRAVLSTLLTEPARVLEIGSGTGQHGVYLCRHMPHLQWQPTDLPAAVPGIQRWVEDAQLENLASPMALDVMAPASVAEGAYDAVFSANTVHFISWDAAEQLLRCSVAALRPGGDLILYGPFNEKGEYTSEGNRQLDAWLKSRDPESGIKDRQAVEARAEALGLIIQSRHLMPANNQILHFRYRP